MQRFGQIVAPEFNWHGNNFFHGIIILVRKIALDFIVILTGFIPEHKLDKPFGNEHFRFLLLAPVKRQAT